MECPICLEKIPHSVLQLTSCKHCFHKECLESWKEQHATCPVCRADISRDKGEFVPSMTFLKVQVEGIFSEMNFQGRVAPSDATIEQFAERAAKVYKVLQNHDDLVVASTEIMQDYMRVYQLQRLMVELRGDQARRYETEILCLKAQIAQLKEQVPAPSAPSSSSVFGKMRNFFKSKNEVVPF